MSQNKSNIPEIFSLLKLSHQSTMIEQLQQENYTTFQILIATLLSSRTKDSTTIPIAKKLFQKYSTPQDFLQANLQELEQALYGIGFYRVKAKNIQKLSKILLDKYNGQVPDCFEKLTSLPGIGRKTANCLLCYVFAQPAIAVDIHVHRFSNRFGWVNTSTPEETELKLQQLLPQELWKEVNSLLVDYGQRVCQPVKPKCEQCQITKYCDYFKVKITQSL